jgi:hypothetical protein
LTFFGKEPELNTFSNEFSELRGITKTIRHLGPQEIAYFGGAPAELIIFLISLAANAVTITDILTKWLNKGKGSVIRFDHKEIQLKGAWTSEEIATVLHTISKQISEEALKLLKEMKTSKISEAEAQLTKLKETIQKYEELVEIFEDISNKKPWQTERAQEYQTRLDELRKEADNIKFFIDSLTEINTD